MIYVNMAKRLDVLNVLPTEEEWPCDEIEVLLKLCQVIVMLQHVHLPNQHAVHPKRTQCGMSVEGTPQK